MTFLPKVATELGTYIIDVTLLDEDGDSLAPATLSWSLKDVGGNVVNSREDVEIDPPTSSVTITLTGADLALTANRPAQRILSLSGTYTTALGVEAALTESATFIIAPLATSTNGRDLDNMLAMMGVLLGDVDEGMFEPDQKVDMLNQGQNRTIDLVNKHALPELDEKALAKTLDDNGAFDLATLNYPILGGYAGVDIVRLTDGQSCRKTSKEEYRRHKDNSKTFNETEPIYYHEGSKIYVLPYENQTIDIHYRHEPAKMILATDSDNNVNCELATRTHDIVIGMAVEDYVDESKPARRAYDRALNMIAHLNQSVTSTDSMLRSDEPDYDDGFNFNMRIYQD